MTRALNDINQADDPTLDGVRVSLRPVGQGDLPYLYDLATDVSTGYRWRFGGATPSPDVFMHAVWTGVLCQFIVEHYSDGPIGHMLIYDADLANGHALFAIMLDPEHRGQSLMLEAGTLLLDYAFAVWPFRKLYAESVEFNLHQFRSGIGRFFEIEGVRRGHEFYNGEYWDMFTLAVYRDAWIESPIVRRYRARLRRYPARAKATAPEVVVDRSEIAQANLS